MSERNPSEEFIGKLEKDLKIREKGYNYAMQNIDKVELIVLLNEIANTIIKYQDKKHNADYVIGYCVAKILPYWRDLEIISGYNRVKENIETVKKEMEEEL